MPFELTSQRLRTALYATISGHPLADIGTDHALLPIAAVMTGRVPSAIGIDRAAKALGGGRARVEEYGVGDSVELRLGDGLEPLRSDDEVATVVMAGVGAAGLIRAMQTPRLIELGVRRLVLQPNKSEIDARQAIYETSGWRLRDEQLVEENDYFYVVFSVDIDPTAEGLALDDVPLEAQLLGTHLQRAPAEQFRRYAESLLEMLEAHLQRADLSRMPESVRRRLERRLAIFERAAS
ncbi:MAG: tRNA (adenine(22)-N(1))-methyltransferase [Myxococcota bacterium]